MTATTVPWPELRSSLETAAARFDTMVAGADGDRSVTGTDWTVHETAVHVVTTIDRWTSTARGATLDVVPGLQFGKRMAEINRREIDTPPSDPDHATGAVARWLGTVPDPTATLHPWGLPDHDCTPVHATGLLLGEVMVHGLDVARTLGVKWPITAREGIAIFDGVLQMLPVLYDGTATNGRTFDIDVRVRGRDRGAGLHCTPDVLVVSDGSPSGAPVHLSADPVAWLLVGYGRQSQMSAALTGKIVAWGRKPWLATKFGQLVQPV